MGCGSDKLDFRAAPWAGRWETKGRESTWNRTVSSFSFVVGQGRMPDLGALGPWRAKVPDPHVRTPAPRPQCPPSITGRNLSYILMGGGHSDRKRDVGDFLWAQNNIPVSFIPTPLYHMPSLDMAIMVHSDAVIISAGSFGFWGVSATPPSAAWAAVALRGCGTGLGQRCGGGCYRMRLRRLPCGSAMRRAQWR